MLPPGTRFHRLLLALIILGNAVAFAGVDPPVRAVTAALVLVLVLDLRRMPDVLPAHRLAAIGLAGLALLQLLPFPSGLRALLQPGLAGVFHPGWAPLSVAPWSTLESTAGLIVAAGIALTAARMAGTRTGLPALLTLLAACSALLAVLGLASETAAPAKVLLLRPNTGGGSPYGPFVNHNHFAQALELSLPAAVVLIAVGARHLVRPGEERRQGSLVVLAGAVVVAVGGASLLRCGSRGGPLFILLAALISSPLWMNPRRATRWPWLVAGAALAVSVAALAWTRLPELEDHLKQLLVVDGVEGSDRLQLWAGTWHLVLRTPVVGVGLGAFRNAIGLDKPATVGVVLEQAHNDWLEWLSTTGVVGELLLLLAVGGTVAALWPSRVRRLRFEYRYALAGTALALLSTALHEGVEFGLHIPLNQYLLACWLGLLWGVVTTTAEGRHAQRAGNGDEEAGEGPTATRADWNRELSVVAPPPSGGES